ncbi:HAD family hydrolase [Pseudonocardia alni]|uniref:HAD family hydrolase n=1 Tax=Pseudonocardia alni TaxID=33907 RepID=UPI001AD73768|nr:HAD hydrolase-like protein [Pseudonocardia alni]MBO4240814.1 HAD hydrolase-like protein [Pseudonocardia alni]
MSPTPPRPVEAVLFDLDGTLVQTRIASWTVFSTINDRFGLGVDGPEQYFDLFRGNVYDSIAKLCRDEAHAAEVKNAFLTLLREEYDPPLVPGVADVVRRLAGHCTLAVMSSNAMQVMRRVLTGNDLAYCFAHVFGGDVTPDKRTAMRTFLADAANSYGRRCSADYDEGGRLQTPDLTSTVLVTDTAGDVRDAVEVGIRAVGVAWGMHSPDELLAAGAEFVALWPQEITAHLLGDAAALPPGGACAVPAGGTAAACTTPPRSGSAQEPSDDAGPPVRGTAAGDGDCGCGCGGDPLRVPLRSAARVRRDRRRSAAAGLTPPAGAAPATDPPPGPGPGSGPPAASPPAPPGPVAGRELLDAVRRVVRG